MRKLLLLLLSIPLLAGKCSNKTNSTDLFVLPEIPAIEKNASPLPFTFTFKDSSQNPFQITATQSPNNILFEINYQAPSPHANTTPNNLSLTLNMISEDSTVTSHSDKLFFEPNLKGTYTIQFTPKDFKHLKEGRHSLNFELFTSFSSQNNDTNPTDKIIATFTTNFTVTSIYRTNLHFKKLVLNKTTTNKLLNEKENDFNNPKPEAGIQISVNNHTIFFDWKKNDYTLSNDTLITFYHNSPDDNLRMQILDVDYVFNQHDLLDEKELKISSLVKEQNINTRVTDELLLSCSTEGKVN